MQFCVLNAAIFFNANIWCAETRSIVFNQVESLRHKRDNRKMALTLAYPIKWTNRAHNYRTIELDDVQIKTGKSIFVQHHSNVCTNAPNTAEYSLSISLKTFLFVSPHDCRYRCIVILDVSTCDTVARSILLAACLSVCTMYVYDDVPLRLLDRIEWNKYIEYILYQMVATT